MSDTIGDTQPAQRIRRAQMRAFISSIGMLPVLIILGNQVANVFCNISGAIGQ